MNYFIHQKDNIKPIQEKLFKQGYLWEYKIERDKPQAFDRHISFNTKNKKMFRQIIDLSNNYEYKNLDLKEFQELFNFNFNISDYTVFLKQIFDDTKYKKQNAMYPYETYFDGKFYHFKKTSEISSYFRDVLGYIVK